MIDILKDKIKELEEKKEKLRRDYSEYELYEHLDNFIKLKKIDGSLETLKEMLIIELQK